MNVIKTNQKRHNNFEEFFQTYREKVHEYPMTVFSLLFVIHLILPGKSPSVLDPTRYPIETRVHRHMEANTLSPVPGIIFHNDPKPY